MTTTPQYQLAAPAPVPSDLAVAVAVARQMLGTYDTVDYGDTEAVAHAHRAVTESLRILVRALDRAVARQKYEAVCRAVDAQFPVVAAFLAAERGEQQ